MKKQRSASPSQAMPRSAFSATTRSRISRLFSSSSGFGSWLGNVPSTSKYISTQSSAVPANTSGASLPATPLAASMTTLYGRNARDVDELVQVLDVGRIEIEALADDARAARGQFLERLAALLELRDAGVAAERQRALPHQLHAVVLRRVVRGRDHDAAVQPLRGDPEVQHLRGHEAEVERRGAPAAAAPAAKASSSPRDDGRGSMPAPSRAAPSCCARA